MSYRRPMLFRREDTYDVGKKDGEQGYPMRHWSGLAGLAYRRGWYVGYSRSLNDELRRYNATHGTDYKPRGPY